ncbi:hypothetical protein PR048_025902 [Dryococelus australis]|uniref:DUF7869 domain-containing protein n=1 Tax=Dryococelus australis TaxID=614101 RepID=A0ABQ9GJU4_9NEOP|nr:hypothetical protein PR048_025902 [Dryococelus australis]
MSHRILSYTYDHRSDSLTAKPDQRGKKTPPNKTPEMAERQVKNFVEPLPTVPSHYCTSDSNKLYLPHEFKNKANVYRTYKNDLCSREGITPVSEKVFSSIFQNQHNIGIHSPKKDKYIICEGSKEYDKQKYSVFNSTPYESGTRNGHCYLWGKCDGKQCANEICSNVCAYPCDLPEIRMPEVKLVSLVCDSCPGQNKNWHMLAMLYRFVQQSKSVQEISITYLLPGHTYMPADSMHPVIESTHRKIIWAPSEWPTIITNSRINTSERSDIRGFPRLKRNSRNATKQCMSNVPCKTGYYPEEVNPHCSVQEL